jgi:thymidylate kinase
VAKLWTRRGVSVAVVGPDGAGKTTLIEGLAEILPFETRVLYMGLTGGRLPRADALRIPGVVLATRLMVLFGRYGAGLYHRAHGRTVLFDRYPLDASVPSGKPLRPLARVSRRVQGAVVPGPDLVLLLDAPGATYYARKKEYDARLLEEWRAAYRRLAARRRSVEILDASRPPDVVRRDAAALIWQKYRDRWLHPKS